MAGGGGELVIGPLTTGAAPSGGGLRLTLSPGVSAAAMNSVSPAAAVTANQSWSVPDEIVPERTSGHPEMGLACPKASFGSASGVGDAVGTARKSRYGSITASPPFSVTLSECVPEEIAAPPMAEARGASTVLSPPLPSPS